VSLATGATERRTGRQLQTGPPAVGQLADAEWSWQGSTNNPQVLDRLLIVPMVS
jgi:hypothetical protein